MRTFKYFLFALVLIGVHVTAFAQPKPGEVEMADTMRSSGRIYVVIAVILTILAGLIFYLVRLDKKITRLEKEK